MIGSSRTEPPFCKPSRSAAREAISKASADEFDIVIGAVDELDLEVDDREAGEHARAQNASRPFSTPGMYSFGTEPPTIFDSKTKPEPCSPRLDDRS